MTNVPWLDSLKEYMHVDGEDDDSLIMMLHDAAVSYLTNTDITVDNADPSQYQLAVNSLTLFYYDHRDSVGNDAALPAGLRLNINQLKHNAVVLRAAEELSNG